MIGNLLFDEVYKVDSLIYRNRFKLMYPCIWAESCFIRCRACLKGFRWTGLEDLNDIPVVKPKLKIGVSLDRARRKSVKFKDDESNQLVVEPKSEQGSEMFSSDEDSHEQAV